MRTFCHTLGGSSIEFVSAVAYLLLASRVLCFRSSMRLSRLFFPFLYYFFFFAAAPISLEFFMNRLSFTRVYEPRGAREIWIVSASFMVSFYATKLFHVFALTH